MADLIIRPEDAETPDRAPAPNSPGAHGRLREIRPDTKLPAGWDTRTPREDTLAERLLTTQSPQRPQSTPRIRIEVDGRVVEGLEGQTILSLQRRAKYLLAELSSSDVLLITAGSVRFAGDGPFRDFALGPSPRPVSP